MGKQSIFNKPYLHGESYEIRTDADHRKFIYMNMIERHDSCSKYVEIECNDIVKLNKKEVEILLEMLTELYGSM